MRCFAMAQIARRNPARVAPVWNVSAQVASQPIDFQRIFFIAGGWCEWYGLCG
jgi:hypothetical protein